MFHRERCLACGECLRQCPQLSLGEVEAKSEIERLREGIEPMAVLTRCSSCFSCNFYCSQGANPFDLILSRWHDRYRHNGAPPVWKFVFPTERRNLWSALHTLLPDTARDTVEGWMTATPAETIFLPGSYFQLVPEVLANSQLLDGLTVLALPGHWECGAYLYQGGYLDVVREIGLMVQRDLDRWGVKRVIAGLDAVQLMLTRIHPEQMGVDFDQEVVNFHRWLLEGLENGRWRIDRKLGRTVTVHDNCYAKVAGTDGFETAREENSEIDGGNPPVARGEQGGARPTSMTSGYMGARVSRAAGPCAAPPPPRASASSAPVPASPRCV